MRTILLLLLFINVSSQPCYRFGDEDGNQKLKFPKDTRHLKKEYIDMTGWSAISTYELEQGQKFNKWNGSPVLIKSTKKEFKDFSMNIILDSHDDTGCDRFTIYYGAIPIYRKEFDDVPQEIKLKVHLDNPSKLIFVIDNVKYISPGATSAMIKIKEL